LYTEKITLDRKQTVFGFEFSELNYTVPEKNNYYYMMDGFDDEWLKTDASHRRVTYTNLNPGTYLFKVKSDINEELVKSVTIVILPPWWKTWWAYTLYSIAILALLLAIRKYLIDKSRLQHEFEIQKIEASKNAEVAQLKQHFFTNISHEFRTPLTLISGPISKLISSAKEYQTGKEVLKYYHLIERNVNRLTELTNQLLDFRKIENGSMRLDIHHGDLVRFIQGINERFAQMAESKQIDLQFSSSVISGEAWFDTDKLDKVITNLISNALKFTPTQGRVSLQIEENPENAHNFLITVKDSGIGIPGDQLAHIFDRFYQVEHPATSFFEGTGIGLALVQELVQMMNGNIHVESIEDVGSTFIVDIPKDISKHDVGQQISNPVSLTGPIAAQDETLAYEYFSPKEPKSLQLSDPDKTAKKPTVLVIEDNIDLRLYIVDTLKDYYQIESAENGEVGIEKALETIPDMVISDIRMPRKDGIEVVRTLKNDLRTSHIPILLLTALNTTEYQLKGFETGADDYITKPFNADILLLKLRNVIALQQRTKEYYLSHINDKMGASIPAFDLRPKEIILKDFEQQFLQQALDVVEQNIAIPDFSVEKLAIEMNMEASTLYKKLMALIGLPPSDFIRDIRMKRAAQLLSQNKLPISEIAYMVGFDSPNYFSKVFKKYYQLTPSEYILHSSRGIV
jgi:signal transduction histidine kinase/DNA-binding response OmpR family regulator